MKFLMTDDKSDEALAIVDHLYNKNMIDKKDHTKLRSFLIFVEADKTKDSQKRKILIDKSFEEIKPLIDLYPDDVSILNNLTVLYGHLGQKEDAIRTAERMINLNPDDGNLFDSYGEMHMLFGDYEMAITKFKRALKLEPKGWFAFQTYLKMGTCYEKLLKLDEAEENYLKGKELTDRMHLIRRELYFHKANEKLEGLKKLREELKNQQT
jgi:tetratricopeptide (TPR) repeat protein